MMKAAALRKIEKGEDEAMTRDNRKGQRGLPTQMNLVIRTVAGVYLLYLAYNIYGGLGEAQGAEKVLFAGIALLFVAIGAAVAFFSLRSMTKGEYAGGAADTGREEEKTAEEENVCQSRNCSEEPEGPSERKQEKTAEEEDG